MIVTGPDIQEIRDLREQLTEKTIKTPMLRCAAIEDAIDGGTSDLEKLEFLQRTGKFKARGALATLQVLDENQLAADI